MRKSIKAELRLLREIAWSEMLNQTCWFCPKKLIPYAIARKIKFGNKNLPPFKFKITIHHKNGNHEDNRPTNRKWSHSDCHKRYHLALNKKVTKWFVVRCRAYKFRDNYLVPDIVLGEMVHQLTQRAISAASAKRKVERKGFKVISVKEKK